MLKIGPQVLRAVLVHKPPSLEWPLSPTRTDAVPWWSPSEKVSFQAQKTWNCWVGKKRWSFLQLCDLESIDVPNFLDVLWCFCFFSILVDIFWQNPLDKCQETRAQRCPPHFVSKAEKMVAAVRLLPPRKVVAIRPVTWLPGGKRGTKGGLWSASNAHVLQKQDVSYKTWIAF